MPSVKLPRKSTATDMTPFVDVAFLILSFFMLATKFKPPQPAEITTPRSVSSDMLKEENAVLVEFDSTGRVFFSMSVKKVEDEQVKRKMIERLNKTRNLGLTSKEITNFERSTVVGVPFNQLKSLLGEPVETRNSIKQSGIPTDSTNNELAEWIGAAKTTFFEHNPDMRVYYMIKGDNEAKYPSFNGIIEAMRKNDQFSYKLVTDPKSVPTGSELYRIREADKARSK